MKKTYSEKLRDPRWQQMRLKIMERDKFTCQFCGSTEKTLNVHHKLYSKGAEPWEYDERILVTCCEDCHISVENLKKLCGLFIKNKDSHNMMIRFLELADQNPDLMTRTLSYFEKSEEAFDLLISGIGAIYLIGVGNGQFGAETV